MSISSSEGSPLPIDLNTKYQKLAAEYAKVRSQVVVLKKAVLEEQTHSSELKEHIKERDQTLRKHDQELDSLTFRNQQLTKRVTVLQEELDRFQVSAKKIRTKHENQDSSVNLEEKKLFQEELQNRILENAKLLSEIEEKNCEHEKDRQKWQEISMKYDKMLAACSGKSESSCKCKILQSKVNELEIALKDKGKFPLRNDVRGRQPRPMWPLLRKLPILEVFNQIEAVLVSIGTVESPASLSQLHNAFATSSPDLFLPALHDHLAHITSIRINSGNSNATINKMLTTLGKLETEIIRCLDTHMVPSQIEETFDEIEEIVRSLRSAAIYHASMVQDDAVAFPSGMLDALAGLQDSCGSLWKAVTQLKASLDQIDAPTDGNQLPCRQCQSVSRQYEEKIETLEKEVSNLSIPSVETLKELNGPDLVFSIPSTSQQPLQINNDFGDGVVVPESWPSDFSKEKLMTSSSAAIADRQLAESKLTRVLSECDAARCRLEQCMEELRHKNLLVSRLQEELSVTTRNYEDQLSSMSEHMANMNDKLAAQQMMIEELTYELSTKDNKKGRTK